ncbi:MAG: iron ABC transporter permease [Spirochaetales bacterium]|nr:iron ABC transporter permease [Spirochaetales bacterium]
MGLNYNVQIYGIIGNAFLFSILTSLLILGISSLKGGTVQIIILAGIALNYILRAGGSLLEYIANPEQLEITRAFSRGELGSFGYSELIIVCSVLLISFLLVMTRVLDLNVMVFGDEKAKTLGVKSSGLRMFIMLISSFLIASIVAFVGPIGFVGLAGPHISRSLVGNNHKIFLPASALVGAVILLGADLIGMNLIAGISIPVGVMTAFIGVPFFLYFIIKERRKFW